MEGGPGKGHPQKVSDSDIENMEGGPGKGHPQKISNSAIESLHSPEGWS